MQYFRQAGFTLIELLVTLVILGLLVGLVGPQFFGKVDSSKIKTTEIQVDMLKMALRTYRLDAGDYPETLDLLWQRPSEGKTFWSGPYIDGVVPLDPWGRQYEYRVDRDSDMGFNLYSFGADGAAGGDGIGADIGYLPKNDGTGIQGNSQ